MRETIKKVLKRQDLFNSRPPEQWLHGVPLGNGDMGAMVWGGPDLMHFTLGESSFWDLRLAENDDSRYNWREISRMIAQGDWDAISEVCAKVEGVAGVTPTYLPVGRLSLDFDVRGTPCSFRERLDLHSATLERRLRHHQRHLRIESFVAAHPGVLCIQIHNHHLARDLRVSFSRELWREREDYVARLGYPPVEPFRKDVRFGFVQEIPGSMFGVVLAAAYRGGRQVRFEGEGGVHVSVLPSAPLLLYLVIRTAETREKALEQAEVSLHLAETMGYEKLRATHCAWWEDYWSRSTVSLSHRPLENLWYLELYKLACCSRRGALPCNLQGVWPTDGELPPWRGGYHANISLQETYWPVYTANRLELAEPLYDWLRDILPEVKRQTREFYGLDGACVPAAADPRGRRLPGWATVQFWPMAGAWFAHHFWMHYRFTLDRGFLRDKAYPFMLECLRFCGQIWQKDDSGKRFLCPTHSPELYGDSPEAWCRNPALDICLMRFLLSACLEASTVLQADLNERRQWQEFLEALPAYPEKDGRLCEWADQSGEESHRHLSHLAPIYPIGDMNLESRTDDLETAQMSLQHLIQRGYGRWMGWTFPWAACVGARLGRREFAAQMLRLYTETFVQPNSLHVVGDFRHRGVTGMTSNMATVEGGFGAAAAINEVLLQSWNGKIRLFSGLPDSWNASFQQLRAENAFLVSAERVGGRTSPVVISSQAGAACVLVSPFPMMSVVVRAGNEEIPFDKRGDEVVFPTVAGQTYVVQDRNAPHPFVFRSVPPLTTQKSNFFGVRETR